MVRMTAAKRRFCSHKAKLQKLRLYSDQGGKPKVCRSALEADCRRFNRRLKRGTCGFLSLSRLRRQLPHQVEPKIAFL